VHLSQPGYARKFVPLASKTPTNFTRGTCMWGPLLCVGTQTKPPARQHNKSAPAYSRLARSLLSSSTPLLSHSTTTTTSTLTLQTSNNSISSCEVCSSVKNDIHNKTRALAQDDNSEPRRSPIQVLTAQRFPPPNCSALIFTFSFQRTTIIPVLLPSCVSFLLFDFLLSSPPLQPKKDFPKDATGYLPQDLPPR
jgi:hypothetical protein